MTRRLVLTTVCALAIATQWAAAQQPAQAPPTPRAVTPAGDRPAPPPPPPAPAAASSSGGQAANVKVEFTITDQRGSEPPVKRTVSVIAADRNLGRVRSVATVILIGTPTAVSLNVDATPTLLTDGRLRLQFTLSYDLPEPVQPPGQGTLRVTTTTLTDSVTLVLENGKPMIAAQSADPIGDRQVVVEVKATILK